MLIRELKPSRFSGNERQGGSGTPQGLHFTFPSRSTAPESICANRSRFPDGTPGGVHFINRNAFISPDDNTSPVGYAAFGFSGVNAPLFGKLAKSRTGESGNTIVIGDDNEVDR